MTVQTSPGVLQRQAKPVAFKVTPQFTVENPFASLSIAQLLKQYRNLPDRTAILGVCDDGLPVLLDLADSTPGSILIGAAELTGVKQLLDLALITTLSRSTRQDVEVLVVSRAPEEWEVFGQFPGGHRVEILPVYERRSGSAILQLCKNLDQRMNGRPDETIRLFILDDLNQINHIDFDVRVNFQWLAKEGPRFGIWTMAGIAEENVQRSDRYLSSFQTRILGRFEDSFQAGWFANARPPETSTFHPTQQFTTRINRNWMNFWLPGQA